MSDDGIKFLLMLLVLVVLALVFAAGMVTNYLMSDYPKENDQLKSRAQHWMDRHGVLRSSILEAIKKDDKNE